MLIAIPVLIITAITLNYKLRTKTKCTWLNQRRTEV